MSVKRYSLQLPVWAFSFSLPKIRVTDQLIRIATWSTIFGIAFSLIALTLHSIWLAFA